jgi:iron complex transport system substrate-binding protein
MVFKSIFRALALFLLVSACNTATQKSPVSGLFDGQRPDSVYTPLYATGFSISYYNDIKLVHINDPWDSSSVGSFVLVGPEEMHPKFRNGEIPFVEYPVTNWSAFSSTQVVFAEAIDVLQTLKAVAEPHYISNKIVQQRLRSGKVRDVGLANAANLEVLLDVSPQFILVSPFKDNRYGPITDVGLLLINDAGYLEATPLGRAEWLVFFSAFFNKEDEALAIFKGIEHRYQNVKEIAGSVEQKPSVVTGALFGDVWYMPAGDSYMAQLFSDAGATYKYMSKEGTGSLSLDFETVFNDFRDCDYWIMTVNHPGMFSKDDFRRMDERYADFEAFQDNHVLFSNTYHSLFYERGIIEPDVVLKDFVACLHPGVFDGYSPVYFEFLND